jgi:hypothetical protein
VDGLLFVLYHPDADGESAEKVRLLAAMASSSGSGSGSGSAGGGTDRAAGGRAVPGDRS